MPLDPAFLLGVLLLGIGAAWLIWEVDIERGKGPLAERREVGRAVYAEDMRVWGGRIKVTTVVGSLVLVILGVSLIALNNMF